MRKMAKTIDKKQTRKIQAGFMHAFDEKNYFLMIDKIGLEKTWNAILMQLSILGKTEFEKNVFVLYDSGLLYEMGLAHVNKVGKRLAGKYYTPKDVSSLMSDLFLEKYDGGPIADVACGCGNLIIELLSKLKKNSPLLFGKLVREKSIYLYDNDFLSLQICLARIVASFGNDVGNGCKLFNDDFLSKKTILPQGINVISNPPYHRITTFDRDWELTESFFEAKDLYIGFFEKIMRFCHFATIITPQSFLVGNCYSRFRQELGSTCKGEVYVFDNVPTSIFSGKKQGVFNSNTSNSVRAAITSFVIDGQTGFRISHMLRFKSKERSKVISASYLKDTLGVHVQNLSRPLKCFNGNLEAFFYGILSDHYYPFSRLLHEKSYVSKDDSLSIRVSNSARYFIAASKRKTERKGYFDLNFVNHSSFIIGYALLNSSYCYAWYRAMDGGILLPKSLLKAIPVPEKIVSDSELENIVNEMIEAENKFRRYKKNGGSEQETIKFPNYYRNRLNALLFPGTDFEVVHSNSETDGKSHE